MINSIKSFGNIQSTNINCTIIFNIVIYNSLKCKNSVTKLDLGLNPNCRGSDISWFLNCDKRTVSNNLLITGLIDTPYRHSFFLFFSCSYEYVCVESLCWYELITQATKLTLFRHGILKCLKHTANMFLWNRLVKT